MYGRVKKCDGQIASDNEFIDKCTKDYKGDRKEAAKHFVMRGWEYFYKNKPDTSMMRFNQAWLLDSLNADVYWGFANLTGMQQKFKESLPLFERAIALNPTNSKIYESASMSYGNMFGQTQDKQYLNTAIHHLKMADQLDHGNARIYSQLAMAYSYFMQKDSSRKYLKLADSIDPKMVDPRIRKIVSSNY